MFWHSATKPTIEHECVYCNGTRHPNVHAIP